MIWGKLRISPTTDILRANLTEGTELVRRVTEGIRQFKKEGLHTGI